MLKLLKNNGFFKKISTCSRGGRAHVARIVLFDRDSCNELILDQRMCTAWYYLTGMTGGGDTGPLGWCELIFRMDESFDHI